MNLHPILILLLGMLISSIYYHFEIIRLVKGNQRKRLALKEASDAVEILNLIDQLREDEGHSVTIVSDNADFNGQPDCLIICVGDWTGWEDMRFAEDTVLDCLRAAVADMESVRVPEGHVCDCCPKPASRILNSRFSKWCAEWFVGYYCFKCCQLVEAEMERVVNDEWLKNLKEPLFVASPSEERVWKFARVVGLRRSQVTWIFSESHIVGLRTNAPLFVLPHNGDPSVGRVIQVWMKRQRNSRVLYVAEGVLLGNAKFTKPECWSSLSPPITDQPVQETSIPTASTP